MKHKIHRKGIRKRYKGLMLAVAGAAVMSSSMLPGLPLAKAHASSNHTTAHYSTVTASELRDDFSKTYSPVQVVKDNAGSLGFNASNDRFSLLSHGNSKATVQVRSSGRTFKVDLVRSGSSWKITTIRGIGNSKYPATYTHFNMPQYQPTTTLPSTPVNQQILFQTTKFNDWSWSESTLPKDMTLGILLQDPRLRETTNDIPEAILKQVENVDFNNQFLLYTHLGSVSSKGYGIGIEKVVQTGNNLTVTVRTKSPQPQENLSTSKIDDYIQIDRTALNFWSPIYITYVDKDGTILITYTINTHKFNTSKHIEYK